MSNNKNKSSKKNKRRQGRPPGYVPPRLAVVEDNAETAALATNLPQPVGELGDGVVLDALFRVAAELIREECIAQRTSSEVYKQAVLHGTQGIANVLSDVREELGSGVSGDDLVAETLFRCSFFQDDVLTRYVAGSIRFSRMSEAHDGTRCNFAEQHGVFPEDSLATLYSHFARYARGFQSYVLTVAWTHGKPTHLSSEKWRAMFDRVGFVYDSMVGARPDAVPTLYRAAIPGHESNWSWTDSKSVALWFLDRVPNSELYVLEGVTPDSVLARFDLLGENEWVVDVETSGLTPMRIAA